MLGIAGGGLVETGGSLRLRPIKASSVLGENGTSWTFLFVYL